jgi:hypothetical protein
VLFAAFAIIVFVLLPAAALVFGADLPERAVRPQSW